MCGKYIVFSESVVGEDGYEYIGGLKYGIKNEECDAIYLAGHKNSLNKFTKNHIKIQYKTGGIINENNKCRA